MASETTESYRTELAAIEKIRAAYPKEPQRTLAKRIIARSHFIGDEARDAATASGGGIRPFFAIYSVIRRYDKRIKAALATVHLARAIEA